MELVIFHRGGYQRVSVESPKAEVKMIKRAAIVNAVALNGGDAAILVACTSLLYRAFPSLERITIFSSKASVVRRYYPDLDVCDQPLELHRMTATSRLFDPVIRVIAHMRNAAGVNQLLAGRWWLGRLLVDAPTKQFLDILPQLDLLCSAGGTYITEHYDWRRRITVLEIAKAQGLLVVFLTQSMWVETGKSRIALLRRTLPKFDLFLVRDAPSASFLTQLGVSADRIHQVADAAFLLADTEAWQKVRNSQNGMRVAVSVREWAHFRQERGRAFESYIDSVAAAVEWLVQEKGAEVTFLSTCQGIPEYHFDDSRIAKIVVDRLPKSIRYSIHIDRDFHDPNALGRKYATFDFVIATRMHAAIIALNAGVPVLPIAYEFKTTELWRSFGLTNYLAEIDEIEPEAFVRLIKQFVANLPEIRDALREGVQSAHTSALSSSDLIRNTVV